MSGMTEQIGRVLGGRYRLLSPLGSGASAQVYLADDVRLRRQVAVKVLHPALADDESFLRRFRAEAQAAASLSHPHLLAVFDWSGDEHSPYLVTEYLSGGSLRGMLDAGGRLSPAQALVVGLEAARALDHAHREGFVHRDIKPANLIFGDDARLRIADFGLARAIAEAGWTETGAVLGTARYASPEQARGETVDGRSDVYSLALVVVEAVTGHVPFTADTTIGTLMARLDRSVDVPAELGPLVPVLEKAGRLDRNERIDAGDLAAGLVGAATDLTRPDPLPLAGTAVPSEPRPDDRDATLVAAVAAPPRIGGSPPPSGGNGAPLGPAPQPWRTGEHPPGPMSANDRSARRLMLGAAVVALAVLVGMVGGWVYMSSRVPSHTVPASLVGMQRSELLDEIGGFGWNIEVEEVRRDDTEPDEVVETRPGAGTKLREGGTLTVVVSQGATLVPVPSDLVGMDGDAAVEALGRAGLQAELVPVLSSDVDEGEVMGFVDGDPGAELPKGATVRLQVSAGDEVEVPDLRGRQYTEAVAELEALGFEVELDDDDPEGDVDVGEVLETRPRAGREADMGDTVTVVVAVEEVEVPAVGGSTLDDATAAIEGEGLAVGRVTGPEDGIVFATWPLEGQQVGAGSSVDLLMRPG